MLGFGLIVLVIVSADLAVYPVFDDAGDPLVGADLIDPGPPFPDVGIVRANPTVPVANSPFRFTEIARAADIDFVHDSGMTEAKHFPTAYGSGVAIFDADNDGLLDLYFANGDVPAGRVRKTGPNRLFRNLGDNHFQDATATSGLGFSGLLSRDRGRRHR